MQPTTHTTYLSFDRIKALKKALSKTELRLAYTALLVKWLAVVTVHEAEVSSRVPALRPRHANNSSTVQSALIPSIISFVTEFDNYSSDRIHKPKFSVLKTCKKLIV